MATRVKIERNIVLPDVSGILSVVDCTAQVNIRGAGATTVYASEDTSNLTTLPNPQTVVDGKVVGYVPPGSYDLAITGTGITPSTLEFEAVRGDDPVSDGTISNVDISASAAIAKSKLASLAIVDADITGPISKSKLGALGIVDADVAGGAAIAKSKLAALNIANADVASGAAIVYSKLSLTGSLLNADVSSSAAIAYSKLNLATSIVNADISTSAAIAYSKLTLTGAILDGDLAGSISNSKLATNPLARANHTGTQLSSTISDLSATARGLISATAPIVYNSGTGAFTLNALVSADISGSAAIPYSKLVLTNSLVAGDLTAGSVTTAKVADQAITGGTGAGAKLAGTTITAANIANATITNTQISASAAIAKTQLAALGIVDADVTSISYAKLSLSNSIVAGDLTTDAVTSAKIIADAVTTVKILDDAVTSAKLQDDASVDANRAVTTNHIKDAAVTDAKVASGVAQSKITFLTPTTTQASIMQFAVDGSATAGRATEATDSRLSNSRAPTGSAGGDLDSATTYPNPQLSPSSIRHPIKQSVKAVATANISIASAPATIDTVTLASQDRVLLTAQITGSENGIYLFPAGGAGATMTRALDANASAHFVRGLIVPSEGGSGGNGGRLWTFTNTGTFTLGSTTPTFIATLPIVPQNANIFLAGPSSGGAGALNPTFRSLVNADIPTTLQPQMARVGLGTPVNASYRIALPATGTDGILFGGIAFQNNLGDNSQMYLGSRLALWSAPTNTIGNCVLDATTSVGFNETVVVGGVTETSPIRVKNNIGASTGTNAGRASQAGWPGGSVDSITVGDFVSGPGDTFWFPYQCNNVFTGKGSWNTFTNFLTTNEYQSKLIPGVGAPGIGNNGGGLAQVNFTAHGYSNGDAVRISGNIISGGAASTYNNPTGTAYTVANSAANTFTLQLSGVDVAYTANAGGGQIYLDANKDIYCEGYSYSAQIAAGRRGALYGNEFKVTMAASKQAKAQAVDGIISSPDAYSTWTSAILGTTSYTSSGTIGLRALNIGSGRAGTGCYVGGNAWQRAFAFNQGGVDKTCIDVQGFLGLGVTSDNTNNTGGLIARVVMKTASTPSAVDGLWWTNVADGADANVVKLYRDADLSLYTNGAWTAGGGVVSSANLASANRGKAIRWSTRPGFGLDQPGTGTVVNNTTIYYCEVFVGANGRITGLQFVPQATGGNVKAGIYDAVGTRVGYSTVDTTVASTTSVPIFANGTTTPVDLIGPGLYYVGLLFSATPTVRMQPANNPYATGTYTTSVTYAGGMVSSIGTPSTTLGVAAQGPVATTY